MLDFGDNLVVSFTAKQLHLAMGYAMGGGIAIHTYNALPMKRAPLCFKRSKGWAHLFDQDKDRLISVARAFGVRVVKVHHEGTEKQHIDLCGVPLGKALQCATAYEEV